MSLAVRCLPSGTKLPAFDLTRRGDIVSISVSAFSTSKGPGGRGVPPDAALRMVEAACARLRQARIIHHVPGKATPATRCLTSAGTLPHAL